MFWFVPYISDPVWNFTYVAYSLLMKRYLSCNIFTQLIPTVLFQFLVFYRIILFLFFSVYNYPQVVETGTRNAVQWPFTQRIKPVLLVYGKKIN